MRQKEKTLTAQEPGLFLQLKVKLCTGTVCRKSFMLDLQFIPYPVSVSYYSPTNVFGLRSALISISCTSIKCVWSAPHKKNLPWISSFKGTFFYGLNKTWLTSSISQALNKMKWFGHIAMQKGFFFFIIPYLRWEANLFYFPWKLLLVQFIFLARRICCVF